MAKTNTSKSKAKATVSKKATPKKTTVTTKPAAKKPTPVKKAAAKKTTLAKVVAKKPVPKPVKPAKKPAEKKPVAKKETPVVSKKKAEAPVNVAKVEPAKVVVKEKPAPKRARSRKEKKGKKGKKTMIINDLEPQISAPIPYEKPTITHSESGKAIYTREYVVKSSPAILFDFVTTPSGLVQWFADKVDINGDTITFNWKGSEESALIIDWIEEDRVKYRWEWSEDDEFFQFRIYKNDITSDTILEITDFSEPDEVDDQKRLWDSQVTRLIRAVGG